MKKMQEALKIVAEATAAHFVDPADKAARGARIHAEKGFREAVDRTFPGVTIVHVWDGALLVAAKLGNGATVKLPAPKKPVAKKPSRKRAR